VELQRAQHPWPDSAEAFYGALFGWELQTFDAGEGAFRFWRLSGYGDHLAERDPDLRRRQEADSAPEGFEDAIAALVPIADDSSPEDTPAHWSITFAVDDADAVADTAAKLGGKVLAPPFDAPYVRMTVVSDPQGAVFTASKYMPRT
jgi:uncharacterized protein